MLKKIKSGDDSVDRFVAFFHIIGLIQKVVSAGESMIRWKAHIQCSNGLIYDEEENNYVSNKTAKA